MTPLHSKLNQLSLTTMGRQLDQTISEAARENLGFPQTLESLADLELEARNTRSIERRFRLSRLQAQHSIDSFHFRHHKSRMEQKTRILRPLDLDPLHRRLQQLRCLTTAPIATGWSERVPGWDFHPL